MVGVRTSLLALVLLIHPASEQTAGQVIGRLDATASAQQQTEQILSLLTSIDATAQQIAAVSAELEKARIDLGTLQGQVAALPNTEEALALREAAEKQIAALETAIQALEVKLAQLEQQLASDEARLAKLQSDALPKAAQADLEEIKATLTETRSALNEQLKSTTEEKSSETVEGKQGPDPVAGTVGQTCDVLRERLQGFKTTYGK